MKPLRTHIAWTAALLLAAAACGGDPEQSPGTAAEPGSQSPDASRQEVDEPQPRLVVATEDGAVVVDPATSEPLAAVDTQSAPSLAVAGDGRHVALTQADAGVTQFLDAGTWSSAHGDHAHHYVAEPRLRRATVDGDRPVHVVSHAGRTAIFHDGSGTAEIFDDDGLLIDSLETATVDSGAPHHGVAVPVEDGVLVSIPGAEELPTGVALVDDDGDEQARFADCPELHGETAVGETVLFGCASGIMAVTGDTSSVIGNPDNSGERVGGFVASEAGPLAVGDYGPTSLAVIDVDADAVRLVELGRPYGPFALGPHDEVLALTTDGTLRVIDAGTGRPAGAVDVIEPFTLPEGHGGTTPAIAVVGHTAYVSDPVTSSLVPVDLEELTTGQPIALDAAPTDIVAIGASEPHDDH